MSYRQHRRSARRALAVERALGASRTALVFELDAVAAASVAAVFRQAVAEVLFEHFVRPLVRDMVGALKPGEVAPRGLLASGMSADSAHVFARGR